MCVKTDHSLAIKSSVVFKGISLFFLILIIGFSSCDQPKKITSSDGEKAEEVKTKESSSEITPVISGVIPTTVNLPSDDTLTDVQNRPFFDEFSWQTFIALSWPVADGQRGVPQNPTDPSTFLNMSNTTPVVWTSYKNQWDLFGPNPPTPWNSTEEQTSPAGNESTDFVFFGSVNGQTPFHGDTDESFSVPLIDQNQNYALFEIRYNKVQYDFIFNNNLFLKSDLVKYQIAHGDTIAMPKSTSSEEGSIMVKAAWRILTDSDDKSRYYVIDELVYDPVTQSNIPQTMGLVGLHIAQKVGEFPEWVWSSFEQVDNVPGSANGRAPYSFNNNSDSPPTGNVGYANKPHSTKLNPDKSKRVPVQVNRLNRIPTTPTKDNTVDLNAKYQAAVGDTWMQYYELVITQWPTNPGQFKQNSQGGTYPKYSGQPFPINNAVNTTMETYFQSQSDAAGAGGNSCMSCHYTANNMDYSWSLFLRSH